MVKLRKLNTGESKFVKQISTSDYNFMAYRVSLDFEWSPPNSGAMQVLLSASIDYPNGSFVQSYIAIDDITFSKECTVLDSVPTLPTLPNHSPAVTTVKPDPQCLTATCLGPNGTIVCLQPSQFCDFTLDCKNGVDEKNCGDCDFDHGDMCGWATGTAIADQQYWQLVKLAYNSEGGLPKIDASNHLTGGYVSIFVLPGANDAGEFGF